GDNQSLAVSLDTTKMPPGIYTIRYLVTNTIDFAETSGEVQFGVKTVVLPTPTAVLPGVAMTPVPVQGGSAPTDLVSRFLIGVGIILLIAIGILWLRVRSSSI